MSATGAPNRSSACDVIGAGQDALLLPALSSISSRDEMQPLAERLADKLRCILVDWPGFGDRPRERVKLTPQSLRGFLDALIPDAVRSPAVGVGAGHAAAYLVDAARRHPGAFARLVLIAPTWRGPFPTMVGDARRHLCVWFRRALEAPVGGEALYRLKVSKPVVAAMMREHVYADARTITPALLAAKLAITRQPNARFGTAAFITGGLDPVVSRADFLRLFADGLPPILMLRPDSAPRKSTGEMDALAATGRVRVHGVAGALAAHEESPDEVARAIRDFVLSPE